MAYEAVITEYLGINGNPVEYTFPASGTVLKGSLMYSTEPAGFEVKNLIPTGSAFFAGIANADNVSGTNASPKLVCITHCVADLRTGSNCTTTVNVPVSLSAQVNAVGVATNTSILDKRTIVGIPLESTAQNTVGAVLIGAGQ